MAHAAKHSITTPQRRPDRIYTTRYVDSRVVILDHQQQYHFAMQQFLADTCYQPPVLLEPEPDFAFLGCTINPENQTLSYIQPTNNLAVSTLHIRRIKATQTLSSLQPNVPRSKT